MAPVGGRRAIEPQSFSPPVRRPASRASSQRARGMPAARLHLSAGLPRVSGRGGYRRRDVRHAGGSGCARRSGSLQQCQQGERLCLDWSGGQILPSSAARLPSARSGACSSRARLSPGVFLEEVVGVLPGAGAAPHFELAEGSCFTYADRRWADARGSPSGVEIGTSGGFRQRAELGDHAGCSGRATRATIGAAAVLCL